MYICIFSTDIWKKSLVNYMWYFLFNKSKEDYAWYTVIVNFVPKFLCFDYKNPKVK